MADNADTNTVDQTTQGLAATESEQSTDTTTDEFTPPQSQEELDRIIANRLTRERRKYADYDSLKERAARYDEMQEKTKTQAQKDAEKITALQQKVADFELQARRAEIAAEHHVPVDLLRGSNEEELEAHAKALAEAFAKEKSSTTGLTGLSKGQGRTTTATDWLRQGFAAKR